MRDGHGVMRAAVPTLSALGLLAGCGSPSPAPPVNPPLSTAPPTSSSPASTPGAAARAVWGVAAADGRSLEIREAPLDGSAAARSVARLDGGRLVAVKGRQAMVAQASSLTLVDLGSGTVTPQPAGTFSASSAVLGGAFSPDGASFAFAAGSPSGGGLRVLEIASHAVRTLVRFAAGATWQAPQVWTASGITAFSEIPFSDAPIQGVTLIDDRTGSTLGSSSFAGMAAVAPDGGHGAAATHASGIGDDPGDSPFPNHNTISALRVGSPPVPVRQRAHHDMSVAAVRSGDGSLLVSDQPVARGTPGSSSSTEFGFLIVRPDGRTIQLDRGDGSILLAGAFDAAGGAVGAVAPAGETSSVDLVVYGPPVGAGGAPSRRVIDPRRAGEVTLVAVV